MANTNETSYTTSNPLIDPIAQYPTTANNDPTQTDRNGGLAAIGGFVYRGSLIPELYGKYVFGDLDRGNGTGRILYSDITDPSLQGFEMNLNTSSFSFPASNIHGVAQDANGEIYYLFGNGQVVELVPEPSTLALAGIGAAIASTSRRRRTRCM
jgi:hypothetical protein